MGTKKDVAQRRERVEAALRERRSRERRRAVMVWGAIAAALAVIAGGFLYGINDLRAQKAAVSLAGVKTYEPKQDHVATPVEYEQGPPVGGPHNPIWLNCGTYEEPVPNENAVHSMEHGAVWVTYRADLSKSQVSELRDAMPDSYAILSPIEQLPEPVVASAWGRQLRLDSVDDPRLEKFVDTYVQGPNTPEPGASCTGGTDGSVPIDEQAGAAQ